jgi:hypothetical protein
MEMSASAAAALAKRRAMVGDLNEPLREAALGASAQEDLEFRWNRLALATPQPDLFCATTHWQLAYREAIDPDCSLIVRQCDEGLIQFARYNIAGARALGPLERNWLFGANLLGPAAVQLLAALLDEPRADGDDFDILVISGIKPEGPLPAELKSLLGARFELQAAPCGTQCAASLQGGLDGFLSRRSANQRRNIRRRMQRAAENGVLVERHAPSSPEEADAVFARMLAVELTSWKGLGRCGMESPAMTRFYSIMLRRLSRSGGGRVMFATLDGRDIGFIFGGLAGGIYRGQQFSFDDRCAELSIGNLLQFEQVKWLCEEGALRYDLGPLLGPSMEYKYYWTELQFPMETWFARAI